MNLSIYVSNVRYALPRHLDAAVKCTGKLLWAWRNRMSKYPEKLQAPETPNGRSALAESVFGVFRVNN
jgi:hypothetical protein